LVSSLVLGLGFLGGCSLVGPEYTQPAAPTAENWTVTAAPEVAAESKALGHWWGVFEDPVLESLIDDAFHQNPSLRIAALRVVEARARRGVAWGQYFPQVQEASGGYSRVGLSDARANQGGPINRDFNDWSVGFDAAWELDLWGRFRRGVEAADAEIEASLYDYDDVLVSLIAEVAATYVGARTLEEKLTVAHSNVKLQARSLEITQAKFDNGVVTELDVVQARTLLRDTQARIPGLQASLDEAEHTLSFLLGLPPHNIRARLGESGQVPATPGEVAVGIPAELLRRRPDIRRAERKMAAQSARIGIAKSDFLPHFSLVGSVSFTAEDIDDMFRGSSLETFGGPGFRWAILNYGRIKNNVRVEDARYQQAIAAYERSVLGAQREVESAVTRYLGTLRQIALLRGSVEASQRAVQLSTLQYREGLIDYVRVLNSQQFLLSKQDRLVATRGAAASGLIAVYKALGGGWELGSGGPYLLDTVKAQMRGRTDWGRVLPPTP